MTKEYTQTTTATLQQRVEMAYWLVIGCQKLASQIVMNAGNKNPGDISEMGYVIDAIGHELSMELAALFEG